MHNEKQIRYVMQCTETHLSCFLFIAQRLVIACISYCVHKHNEEQASCNAMKHILGVFCSIAQRLVIACISITRNKLDAMQ